MNCNVKGLVLEKFTKGNGKDTKNYIRLYQVGERMNLDVSVSNKTFDNVKQGENIELQNISVLAYKDNLYARES